LRLFKAAMRGGNFFMAVINPAVQHLSRKSNRILREEGIRVVLALSALFSVATTVGIVYTLVSESIHFFQQVSLAEFFLGTEWAPLFSPPRFGVLPLVNGTLLVTAVAAIIAVPLGVGAAIYLSEFASQKSRAFIKPILEVLAGIPTIVYGFFALVSITPVLQKIWPQTQVFNVLSGSIAVAIMILPTIASLCDDALRSVPDSLRQGGYAMGATKLEVTSSVVLPAALSGILAAIILALSRAIGETMIVVIACGGQPNITANVFEPVQTMTAFIVAVSLGDTPHGTIGYLTIFAVGSLLFLITLCMNIISNKIMRRFREVYE
jgi:phosphate transport system permease protein